VIDYLYSIRYSNGRINPKLVNDDHDIISDLDSVIAVVQKPSALYISIFYNEMLEEMQSELEDKQADHAAAHNEYQPMNLAEATISLIQSELKRLIELLDSDVQNPELEFLFII